MIDMDKNNLPNQEGFCSFYSILMCFFDSVDHYSSMVSLAESTTCHDNIALLLKFSNAIS